MNLLLGKYNNNNYLELNNIIHYYQDYFTFKVDNDHNTMLYLNTEILKNYLENGIEIKYRKYIFVFLKNIINLENNKIYKLLDQQKYIFNNKNIIKYEIFDNTDYKNLEHIINLSIKINNKKNRIKIRDKSIIKLNKDFYANVYKNRFLYKKNNDNIFHFNGIIINYYNFIKNKILSIMSIFHSIKYKPNKFIIENNIQILTKCNLIVTDKKNIELWICILQKYYTNAKFLVLSKKKNIKNIKNGDIEKTDFLIVNSIFLSNKFYKNNLNKYSENLNNLNESILNSVYDNIYNKNIKNETLNNLYLFKWNNIIYDNIQNINNDKIKFILLLSCNNTKYYLVDDFLSDNIIDIFIENSISNILNDKSQENIINNYNEYNKLPIPYSNFYYFIKNELIIKNNEMNVILDYVYIDINLCEKEKNIYNILFYDNNNIDNKINNENNILSQYSIDNYNKISMFYLDNDKYNFNIKDIDEINELINSYYNIKIIKETTKLCILNNQINNFLEENTNNLNSNVLKYNSQLQYFKNNILKYNDSKDMNCSMCIDNINKEDFTIILCGHYFCKYCLIKYINEKNNNLECPICRDKFNESDIYCPFINNNIVKNIDINNKYSSKIDKLLNIIDTIDDKIIIITQFKSVSNKLTNIFNNNNIKNYNMFYNNNYFKEKNKNLFNNEKNKIILISTIDDILKYNFINISNIIFIDIPYINEANIDIFNSLRKKYLENYLLNINKIKYYFLYIKNSIEEYVVNKYIKI
jgi:hypothetical protein